jgi:hypothetical protein
MADCCDCCKKIEVECCKNGLGAIKNSDRRKIRFSSSRDIKCSIDIDSCLKVKYPNANRWDYLICYKTDSIFVEIHPAENTSNIEEVIKKKDWLDSIIKSSCINVQNKKFYWIASGRVKLKLDPRSKQSKMLAKKRINLVSFLHK